MAKYPFKVIIDCDNAANEMKASLLAHIKAKDIDITDLNYGTDHADAMYPEIGYNLAQQIKKQRAERGILLCGTGLGMAMIANKVPGVFAGTAHDTYSAERLKKSNDANVLTMGARVIGIELAKSIVDHWLDSEFSGGSSAPKVQQLQALDRQAFGY